MEQGTGVVCIFTVGENYGVPPSSRRQQQSAGLLHSLSKNLFFDRLTEFKKAAKTSKMSSSAYVCTVEIILRSKSKSLAAQGFAGFVRIYVQPFCKAIKQKAANHQKIIFLTVCRFFDTLIQPLQVKPCRGSVYLLVSRISFLR